MFFGRLLISLPSSIYPSVKNVEHYVWYSVTRIFVFITEISPIYIRNPVTIILNIASKAKLPQTSKDVINPHLVKSAKN